MDKSISKRISITRYAMVIGIIVLHLPPAQPLSALSGSLFESVKAFFAHGLFRTTVPMLTVISGYLIFNSGLHLYPKRLLYKKTRTLLLPLIIWNIPFAIFVFIVQKYSLVSHEFRITLYPVEISNWPNAIFSLTDSPVNYPLRFLRDLFILSLLAPVFWLLLKRTPYLGLAVILVIYYFNYDAQLVLRNSMMVSFYIGALAAHQKWDTTILDNYAAVLFTCLVFACMSIVYFKIENREVLRLIAPFLVWPAMSLFVDTNVGNLLHRYSENSFFTFVSHGPIILAIWLIFSHSSANIPYFVYWFLTPILTVVISVYLNTMLKKHMPSVSSFVLGSR